MLNTIQIVIGELENNGGSQYTTEYQAVLNRAISLGYDLPSEDQRTKDNNAIISLKANGIWPLLDLFYGMTGNINFATLNWKDPLQYQLSLVNSPTYSTTNGFIGNGTTSYLTTNWQPSVGTNFTQNDCGIGGLSTIEMNTAIALYGGSNPTLAEATYILPRVSGSGNYRINQSATTTWTASTGIGRYHEKRTGSTATSVFRNGISVATGTTASTVRTTSVMILLGINRAGSITNLGAQGIKCFWAGASLNGLESTFDSIIQNIYA